MAIPIPTSFKIYRSSNPRNSFAGSATLIHNSIQHQAFNTTSNEFDIITVTIQSKIKFLNSSVYISPHTHFTLKDLQDTLNTTQLPHFISGDFNSWHASWGSTKNNKRGNTVSKFVTQSTLTLLNDGRPTHYTTHHTFTHVDLTLSSPNIALQSEWEIEPNLSGSDHFPLVISLFPNQNPTPNIKRPKFNMNKADWEKFNLISNEISSNRPTSSNINKEAANIQRIILNGATHSIAQTRYSVKKSVPWWNKKLQELKMDRNRCWNVLNRNISLENIVKYKKANNLFKRELKSSKSKSMNEFTSNINPRSPTGQVWSTIRRFCGLKRFPTIHCIKNQDSNRNTITDQLAIANLFGTYWSKASDDTKFSRSFLHNKYRSTSATHNSIVNKTALHIESKITSIELSMALSKLKGHTPGIDRITYSMIRNSSNPVKLRILSLYNNIFENYLPQIYKNSLVIPIPKPNLDKSSIDSYRPISLNPCCAKVLDKIIANRLWWFITTNKLLHSHQIGFRKGKSVSDSLIYLDHQITHSLYLKKHISVISLDFSKAFDKIGVHTVLDQLMLWKIGPKIFNYIKHFMTNRKIRVRIGHYLSQPYPFQNGIPQGSPLSVSLFLIAYNKLCGILSLHKELDFLAYADDFILIKKLNKNKCIKFSLNNIQKDIITWCDYSGAELSMEKCKHIHICRKHNCRTEISSNNSVVNTVETIKILGITFNTRYNWNTQIQNLLVSLDKRLNIIKCLSNQNYNCNPASLISAVKALIVSKINYGLYLFGYSPKSILNKLKTILNAAIRASIGAYRTTPINNLTYEANFTPIILSRELITVKQCKAIIANDQSPLSKLITKINRSKRLKKIPSVINRIIGYANHYGIPINNKQLSYPKFPSWQLPPTSVDTSLHYFTKNETSPEIYNKLFLELTNRLKTFKFIYTDGSKIANCVSFSAVYNDETIIVGQLPAYSSSFTAEIIAIHEAIKFANHSRGKFAIATDSLSSLEAIKSHKNTNIYADSIRNLLIKNKNKIKLVWVPSHVQIKGNELADLTAKEALRRPLIMSNNYLASDIQSYIKKLFILKQNSTYDKTTTWYKKINPQKLTMNEISKIDHNSELTRKDLVKLARIRLGHSTLTNQHLIDKNATNICRYCNRSVINIEHILEKCQFFNQYTSSLPNTKSIDLLTNPTLDNLKTFLSYLKYCNLYDKI